MKNVSLNLIWMSLLGVVSILLMGNIASKVSAIYDLALRAQPSIIQIGTLVVAAVLQGIGGCGLIPTFERWRHFAFGTLYVVGTGELGLYILSTMMLHRPDICAVAVGSNPGELIAGQASFLALLFALHYVERSRSG